MPTTPSLRGPDRPSRRDRLRDESRNRNCNRMPRRNVNRNAVNRSNTNRNGLQSSPRNRCCQPTASTRRVTSSARSKARIERRADQRDRRRRSQHLVLCGRGNRQNHYHRRIYRMAACHKTRHPRRDSRIVVHQGVRGRHMSQRIMASTGKTIAHARSTSLGLEIRRAATIANRPIIDGHASNAVVRDTFDRLLAQNIPYRLLAFKLMSKELFGKMAPPRNVRISNCRRMITLSTSTGKSLCRERADHHPAHAAEQYRHRRHARAQ